MKKLFQLTSLVLLLTSLSANASIEIKSIELNDSTVINASEISAITLHNEDSSIESFELNDGTILESSLIKKINTLKVNSKFNSQLAAKVGGEGTGG